jgi:hypothetical protein
VQKVGLYYQAVLQLFQKYIESERSQLSETYAIAKPISRVDKLSRQASRLECTQGVAKD